MKEPGRQRLGAALSFLYLAFVRLLQLVRLFSDGQEELAIEVVMLRHEVAVLSRQVAPPALQPADRALLAGLSRFLSMRVASASSSSPRPCFAGIEIWCDGIGRTRTDEVVDRRFPLERSPWFFVWPKIIRAGDIGASTGSWQRWASRWHLPTIPRGKRSGSPPPS